MKILQDQVAVITGATRGIGLAIASLFAQEGAAVIISSRSPDGVNGAVETIRSRDGKVDGIPCDVGDLEQVKELARFAISKFGKVDIWVNNAGVAGPYGPTTDISPIEFEKVVRTNILGTYYGSMVALSLFRRVKRGKLINILGRGDKQPTAWQNAYAPSKAWMRSFTIALAQENQNSPYGIFGFSPGMVRTELLTSVPIVKGYEQKLKVFPTIIRMWAKDPEIPARKALWLASSATDGKTGLILHNLSPLMMLMGALKEGLLTLFQRPKEQIDIKLFPIEPYRLDIE